MANLLSHEKRLRVLAALLDGNSVRAASRMTGVHQDTISRFAFAAGTGAGHLHNRLARNLSCTLIEMDEIWTWCGVKEARKTAEHPAGFGDVWVWVAVCGVSRMVISWHAGRRDQASADAFMTDVRARLVAMPQITSDGYAAYEPAVAKAFGAGVDFGQVVKTWQKGGKKGPDHRYEPSRDPLLVKRAALGAPNLATSTTAHVERNNLTIRHMNGRLRRLCLAFSKRPENHRAALALSYAWFNLGRVQKGMKITPAMAAGVTDHIWELDEFLTAVMTAEPCESPAPVPLVPRVPETTHRELPSGRGFLRVVDGGKGKPSEAPRAPTPPAAPPARVGTGEAPREPLPPPGTQLDLFAWRPRPRQLAFFDDDPNDEQW
ncbi:transposase [Polyangium jinanense]|uniref:Transposase n=1 Tax=Polyangium jinanense TaxID=2829994 RepID=A0A9X3XJT6_9BACT|nr:transposase [Polyangium jinanense]MDC3962651.1 transposase [Polyangium jinanense]MDC3989371.1 transposase [Polyangium jinanense]